MTTTATSLDDAVKTATLSDDKFKYVFGPIVYKHKSGKNLIWSIEVYLVKKLKDSLSIDNIKYKHIKPEYLEPMVELDESYVGMIRVISFQEGGKIREVAPTFVTTGKNIGKANQTNVLTQALRDAFGKFNKQKKAISSVDENNSDKRKMPPPMLLKSIDDEDLDFSLSYTAQRKYNGVRVVFFKNHDEIIMYSRSSTRYVIPEHLNKDLEVLFNVAPKGIYLDGEFYKHGLSLQELSGTARAKTGVGVTKSGVKLDVYLFDCFYRKVETPSSERQDILSEIFEKATTPPNKLKYFHRVENFSVNSSKTIKRLYEQFLSEGYEGLILRRDDKPYIFSYNGHHTPYVLKYKPVFDEEFNVVGYTQGSKGKDVGAIIWICETKDGKQFNVVPNMPLEERKEIFNKIISEPKAFKKYYKNRPLTVEYRDLTKDGIPSQAKGIAFRTYE